jgi:hypothetical protein
MLDLHTNIIWVMWMSSKSLKKLITAYCSKELRVLLGRDCREKFLKIHQSKFVVRRHLAEGVLHGLQHGISLPSKVFGVMILVRGAWLCHVLMVFTQYQTMVCRTRAQKQGNLRSKQLEIQDKSTHPTAWVKGTRPNARYDDTCSNAQNEGTHAQMSELKVRAQTRDLKVHAQMRDLKIHAQTHDMKIHTQMHELKGHTQTRNLKDVPECTV